MDTLGSTMFFELCRLCLRNPGVNKVSSYGNLLIDIFNCTSIKISARDNLPQNVCNSCMNIVKQWKELRQLATQNDSNLRMLFGETSEEQGEVRYPETMGIQVNKTSAPTIHIQERPKQISVRTDLFEKPTKSDKATQCKSVLTQIANYESERLKLMDSNKSLLASISENKATILKLQNKLDETDRLLKEQLSKSDELSLEVKRLRCRNTNIKAKSFGQHQEIQMLRQQIDTLKADKKEPRYEKKRRKFSHSGEEDGSNNNHIKKITKLNIIDSESSVTNKETNDDSSIVKDDKEKVKLKTLKTENRDELICNVCSKKFDTSKKLYLHSRQHDKKIICDMCGKKFTNKSELDRHVRTHTGEKPFSCDICDKKFAQKVTLKQHKESVHIPSS